GWKPAREERPGPRHAAEGQFRRPGPAEEGGERTRSVWLAWNHEAAPRHRRHVEVEHRSSDQNQPFRLHARGEPGLHRGAEGKTRQNDSLAGDLRNDSGEILYLPPPLVVAPLALPDP